MHAVQALPGDFNAFPHRGSSVIVSANIIFPDGELPRDIFVRGERIRDAVRRSAGENAPLDVYVNYALGTESLGSVYGHEGWSLERLRSLKERYDPKGVFNHYMPVN